MKVVRHFPVMLSNVIKRLKHIAEQPEKKNAMLDCTLGTGGHTLGLLEQYPNLYIHGIDLDQRMINDFNERHLRLDEDGDELEETSTHRKDTKSEESPAICTLDYINLRRRLSTRCANYTSIDKMDSRRVIPNEARVACTGNFDMILADLGYNMVHLANSDWGFSYMNPGKLDMRYSQDFRSCQQILRSISELELEEILRMYGELGNSNQVAKELVKRREMKPLKQVDDIKEAIFKSENIRDKFKTMIKVFQALRIATNGQLVDLKLLMTRLPQKLNEGGVGMVITFHSLEAKLVMRELQQHRRNKVISKIEVEEPSSQQLELNSSSRSAKMFSFVRTLGKPLVPKK